MHSSFMVGKAGKHFPPEKGVYTRVVLGLGQAMDPYQVAVTPRVSRCETLITLQSQWSLLKWLHPCNLSSASLFPQGMSSQLPSQFFLMPGLLRLPTELYHMCQSCLVSRLTATHVDGTICSRLLACTTHFLSTPSCGQAEGGGLCPSCPLSNPSTKVTVP